MYHAVPSRLFRNLRNGKFEDITEASGINRSYGPALGVVCADFNGDGRTGYLRRERHCCELSVA